jgi:plastocyanin
MSQISFRALCLLLLSLVAAVDAAGLAVDTIVAERPGVQEVKIDNFSFRDQTITVPAGTEVHWMNRDDIPHTVVSEDKTFKSKVLDTDDQFSFAFTKPGTYKYFCSIHPKMTGTVVVQ